MSDESVSAETGQGTARLLALYDQFPFEFHPLWQAVLAGRLTREQVLRAEVQHFLRTRAGRALRKEALETAMQAGPRIWSALFKTYVEECAGQPGKPNHLELIKRLLIENGMALSMFESARPTPGNSAAIALYRDIASRGVGCHLIGAGVVENFYSQLSPKIYDAYVRHYGMSPHSVETYHIHAAVDREHADRALAVLEEATALHGFDVIEQSVRDAFAATSLHYDGMLQAAEGKITYWDGSRR